MYISITSHWQTMNDKWFLLQHTTWGHHHSLPPYLSVVHIRGPEISQVSGTGGRKEEKKEKGIVGSEGSQVFTTHWQLLQQIQFSLLPSVSFCFCFFSPLSLPLPLPFPLRLPGFVGLAAFRLLCQCDRRRCEAGPQCWRQRNNVPTQHLSVTSRSTRVFFTFCFSLMGCKKFSTEFVIATIS